MQLQTVNGPRTFDAAIYARGLKVPKPRTVKQARADVLKQAPCPARKFPSPLHLMHQLTVERQSPLFTGYYDDDGVTGYVFSSPGLTAWYVESFCKANHLKG
jgi:hypothetical protein